MTKDLEALAKALDSRFKVGGFRFGWDGIVGLIPVVGDLLTGGASLYIVARAFGMGVPLIIVLKMLMNIGLETLVGLIPVVGNIFDFVWKANSRNLDLLRNYEDQPGSVVSRSWLSVASFGLLLVAVFVGLACMVVLILQWMLSLF